MRIFKLILVLIVFMALTSLAEEKLPFIRETFSVFILFIAIKIALLVLIVKFFWKRNLSVK